MATFTPLCFTEFSTLPRSTKTYNGGNKISKSFLGKKNPTGTKKFAEVRCYGGLQEVDMFVKNFGSTMDFSKEILQSNLETLGNSAPLLAQKGMGYLQDINGSSVSLEVIRLIDILKFVGSFLSTQGSKLIEDPQHFNAMAMQIGSAMSVYSGKVGVDSLPVASTALATVAGSAALGGVIKSKRGKKGGDGELPLKYDPASIGDYFERRPRVVAARLLELSVECSNFAAGIAIDKAGGKLKENEKLRAKQFVDLITKLGPTFIKLGQALSIRPDVLPVAYLDELQKLQDRVPPFSNELARISIAEGLGMPLEEVLSEISVDPIAAASLGQVYKGTLRETGEVVAVKVQRPDVLEVISRDVFLLRKTAEFFQSIPSVQSDLVALVDNLASRFYDEIDYIQEAMNAERFAETMKSLDNIKVPRVFMQYTSRKVLITEWVEGEKLSDSQEGDSLYLVNTALNCYLVQLLESGFLHADPHPGNLLRTADGNLCVLDYGLMTEVTEEQRYAFIEYISHLMNEDYEKVADDLVRLGFVPPEFVDPVKTAEVVPLLSRVLSQLTQGGGAWKVNVQQVTNDLAKISEDYVFVVPPYFALILKVFSILEGIGLERDPDYTIIDGCYPYLSKRLITDDSPRTRAILKYYLYGETSRLDIDRIEDMFNAFDTYRKLTTTSATQGSKQILPSIDPAAKEALLLLFAPNGSFLQDLLLKELVCAVDALSRAALAELWQFIASQLSVPLPTPVSAPGTWPLFLPDFFLGPMRMASLSEDDEHYLNVVKRLWVLLEPQFRQQSSSTGLSQMLQGAMPLFPDLFPGVAMTTQRFLLMLLQRQALRLADDLDGKNSIVLWKRNPMAFANRHKPSLFEKIYKGK